MQLPASFILLLLIGGGFLILVHPFTGAIWVGLACVALGLYQSVLLRKRNQKRWEEYRKNQSGKN